MTAEMTTAEMRAAAVKMDIDEQRGSKLFQDSVHGVMRFHRLLVKLIDTPEFQRLRNIKQLSTTYLVYPAAAHNRFEHCLGVCWLAGELIDELKKNSPAKWRDIFPDEKEDKKIKLAVQIAGLLHDLGHGPFSHTWEGFVQATGGKWDHEETSSALIDYMLWQADEKNDDNLTPLGKLFKEQFEDVQPYVMLIKSLISGNSSEKGERAFLYEVVANKVNDIDVDKWDYFLRDAQHLKMSISFDYKRLKSLCKIITVDGTNHIAFRDVEQYSIEGMFRDRADLHVRAYQHRVAKCIEAMLIDALKEADKGGFTISGIRLSKVHEHPAIFCKLTDSIKETLYNSEEAGLATTRGILERIATRDLYKTVGEWPLEVKQTTADKNGNKAPSGMSRGQMESLEKLLKWEFCIVQTCINQGKYYEPLKEVIFYEKENISGESNIKELEKKSITDKHVPNIKMDLPFYKLIVFKRSKDAYNIDYVKKTIEDFLREKGFMKHSESRNI